MIRSFLLSTLFFALVSVSSAQVIPIFDARSGSFLGGARDGIFIDAAEAFKEISGMQNFTVIGPSGEKRDYSAKISAPTEPCDDYYYVEREGAGELGIGIGKGLNWNPVPRPIKSIAVNNKTYLAAVTALLRSKGMATAKAIIEQVVSVDLDGDGADEVLITASTYRGKIAPSAKRGDYSVVFMRKIVAGKIKNIILGEEYIKKSIQFGAPTRFEISGIADLNGDGKMEIAVYDEYYEGAGAAVYEVTKTGAVQNKVISAGCGV